VRGADIEPIRTFEDTQVAAATQSAAAFGVHDSVRSFSSTQTSRALDIFAELERLPAAP
jgi:hypothetical protein